MVLLAMLSTYFVLAVVLVAVMYANRKHRHDAVESRAQPDIGPREREDNCFLCNAPREASGATTAEGVVRALERRIVSERSSIDQILNQPSQVDLTRLYLVGGARGNGARH